MGVQARRSPSSTSAEIRVLRAPHELFTLTMVPPARAPAVGDADSSPLPGAGAHVRPAAVVARRGDAFVAVGEETPSETPAPAAPPPTPVGNGSDESLHAAPTGWLRDGERSTLTEMSAVVAPNASAKSGWARCSAFIGPAILISVGYMDPGAWYCRGGGKYGLSERNWSLRTSI